MGSLSSLMYLARDGMLAQSAALDLTGQNIANASTPGYVRRSALLEARAITAGATGGVDFTGIQRHFDRFAEMRVLGESGLLGAARARAGGLAGLEAWLTPSEGGVGDRTAALFSAATELASNASDPAARSSFLARAEELATSFRVAGDAMATRRGDLFAQAQDGAAALNRTVAEIAELNQQIAAAQAAGEPAADLRDRRDQLVRGAGDMIGARGLEEPNGMVTLIAAGTTLLQGDQASALSVTLGAGGDLAFELKKPGGSVIDITSRVDGGELGGIKEARDVDLVALQKDLDVQAFDFMNAANAVHQAGFGLDGVTGRPLFTPPASAVGAARSMTVDPSVAGQPDKVAASGTAAGLPAGNDVALAFADLASKQMGAGGTPAERYGAFGAKLGTMQQTAANGAALREETLAMAEALRQQSSGVSLEEEMVDLSRYQRAFEATMRVLRVADELLEGLIREV